MSTISSRGLLIDFKTLRDLSRASDWLSRRAFGLFILIQEQQQERKLQI